MTWLISLVKAGTNPDQALRASISCAADPRKEGLELGAVVHIGDQPDNVKWKIEEIIDRRRHFAVPTGNWMNGRR